MVLLVVGEMQIYQPTRFIPGMSPTCSDKMIILLRVNAVQLVVGCVGRVFRTAINIIGLIEFVMQYTGLREIYEDSVQERTFTKENTNSTNFGSWEMS